MKTLLELPVWMWAIWAVVIGAAVGSFLNVVIHRVPLAKSILKPPSHCPKCERKIRPWNNIPLVSYWLLGAKCPDCGEHIPIRYFIVELLGAVVALWPLLLFGPGWEALGAIILGWHLIALAFIDIETLTIPDHIVIPMAIGGLTIAVVKSGTDGLVDALLACAIGAGFQLMIYAVSKLILKRDGIGGGDITMTAGFSLYLHPLVVAYALVSSAALGLIGTGIIAVIKRKKIIGKDTVVFGPYLALGAWMAYLYGGDLISAYMNWVINRI